MCLTALLRLERLAPGHPPANPPLPFLYSACYIRPMSSPRGDKLSPSKKPVQRKRMRTICWACIPTMQWHPSPPDGLMRKDCSADTLALWLQDFATLTGCEALAAVLRRRCAAALPGAPLPLASGPAAARNMTGTPNVAGEVAAPASALALPSTQALPVTDSTGDGGAPAPFDIEVGLADIALTGLALSQAAQHREFAEQVRGPNSAA